MIQASSSFILEEFATAVNDAVNHFEKEGRIKTPLHKEVLKFESTAFVFWLFRGTNIFPEAWRKLILDEMHQQYFSRLKKHGYNSTTIQAVCDDFNLRYKTYDEFFGAKNDFSRVGAKFISFVNERAKIDLNLKDLFIPLYLIEKLRPKFEEFRNVIKS